jgi:hypothetical protein
MIEAGIQSELQYFKKGGHGFWLDQKEDYLKPMLDFFNKVLNKEK